MVDDRTLELIVRLLEECLEHDYNAEELRSKVMDMLRLLNGGVLAKRSHSHDVPADFSDSGV